MIFDIEKLRSVTFGALGVYESGDGGFVFSRFTDIQKDNYYVRFEKFGGDRFSNTFSSTSIKLDFYTDAQTFSFAFSMKACAREELWETCCNFIDVMLDGVLYKHYGARSEVLTEAMVKIKLPEGTHRITVYLSSSSKTNLGLLELSGETFFEPAKPSKRIYILGDSITQGYYSEHPYKIVANRISAEFDAEVLNQAVSGEFFDEMHVCDNMPINPYAVILAYGTNDAGHFTADEIAKSERAMMRKVKKCFPEARYIYISPIYRSTYLAQKTAKDYEIAFESQIQVAKEEGFTVISGSELLLSGDKKLSDGLHPLDAGFDEICENLLPRLSEVLK